MKAFRTTFPDSSPIDTRRVEQGRRSGPRGALALAATLALLSNQAAVAAPEKYVIDPEHLSVGFLVTHLGYSRVLGMFRETSGSYTYDPDTGRLSDVEITIMTDSVFTNHRKRDDHLRSADFLNSKEFPKMVFRAGEAMRGSDRSFDITGQLELLGKKNPVSLAATINKAAPYEITATPFESRPWVMGVSARGSVPRTAYGMNYAASNGWVGDEIELIIEFEARRQ